jgi:hypothetical protein
MVDHKIQIQTCEHADEIAIFCGPPHNIALCNDCYFEKQDVYGKGGRTMKKAALEQISALEGICVSIIDAVRNC